MAFSLKDAQCLSISSASWAVTRQPAERFEQSWHLIILSPRPYILSLVDSAAQQHGKKLFLLFLLFNLETLSSECSSKQLVHSDHFFKCILLCFCCVLLYFHCFVFYFVILLYWLNGMHFGQLCCCKLDISNRERTKLYEVTNLKKVVEP